jgi:ZIP family zinc transporter
VVVLALLAVAGTAPGVLVLAGASPTLLAGVLAFGAVAFMCRATEEVLVEAHAGGETSLGSSGYFLGFLIYLVLTELIGQPLPLPARKTRGLGSAAPW